MTVHFNIENINLKVFDDYEEMSLAASSFIYQTVIDKPNLLLCPASGNSPRSAYNHLVKKMISAQLNHAVKVISLDEWVGLAAHNQFSGAYQLKSQLIDSLDVKSYFLFNGDNPNEKEEIHKANNYLHENGPVDLCILGIGTNGHLGFNEPGEYLHPTSHRIRLTEASCGHQMVADSSYRPEYGITLGMKDILLSKKILLLVNGEHKKPVMKDFLSRKITSRLPASLLWLHPEVTCLCSKDAVPI